MRVGVKGEKRGALGEDVLPVDPVPRTGLDRKAGL